jgi:hypothetical protein
LLRGQAHQHQAIARNAYQQVATSRLYQLLCNHWASSSKQQMEIGVGPRQLPFRLRRSGLALLGHGAPSTKDAVLVEPSTSTAHHPTKVGESFCRENA